MRSNVAVCCVVQCERAVSDLGGGASTKCLLISCIATLMSVLEDQRDTLFPPLLYGWAQASLKWTPWGLNNAKATRLFLGGELKCCFLGVLKNPSKKFSVAPGTLASLGPPLQHTQIGKILVFLCTYFTYNETYKRFFWCIIIYAYRVDKIMVW